MPPLRQAKPTHAMAEGSAIRSEDSTFAAFRLHELTDARDWLASLPYSERKKEIKATSFSLGVQFCSLKLQAMSE